MEVLALLFANGAQGLEFLAHEAGVDELAELGFQVSGLEAALGECSLEEIAGSFDNEGFLAFEGDV